jgi:hypothetical protein
VVVGVEDMLRVATIAEIISDFNADHTTISKNTVG